MYYINSVQVWNLIDWAMAQLAVETSNWINMVNDKIDATVASMPNYDNRIKQLEWIIVILRNEIAKLNWWVMVKEFKDLNIVTK